MATRKPACLPPSLLLLLTLLLTPLRPRIAIAENVQDAPVSPRSLVVTLDAVEAAVGFMGRHVDRTNLDGVIGLRAVEGQFTALLARYWYRLPPWLAVRLKELQMKAMTVSESTIAEVRRRTPKYFANAGPMIGQHSWDTFYPTRPLPQAEETSGADGASAGFSEKFSDDCIAEFNGSPKCRISSLCWEGIVQPRHLKDYSLTHQVFYLLNGIQSNCLPNLTSVALGKSGRAVPQLLDEFCARIVAAADELAAAGPKPPERDLFMEQIGLCAIAGYSEAARSRWLPRILAWQRPSGCYGSFHGETLDPRNFQPGRYGNLRRRKRAESRMTSDGCLSHRTAVALHALVAFVRRGVEESLELSSDGQ